MIGWAPICFLSRYWVQPWHVLRGGGRHEQAGGGGGRWSAQLGLNPEVPGPRGQHWPCAAHLQLSEVRDNKVSNSYSLCGCSDEYTQLFPYAPNPTNPGGTIMKTADQVREENITIVLVNKKNVSFQLSRNDSSSPPCSQSWWETLWILSRAGRSYWRLISKDMSARFGRFLTGTNLKPLYRLFNRIFFTTKLGNSFPTSSLSGFTSHRIRIPVPTSPSGSPTLCLVDTSQSTQVKSVWNESCQ